MFCFIMSLSENPVYDVMLLLHRCVDYVYLCRLYIVRIKTTEIKNWFNFHSINKIEKVPRDIQGEKSRKDKASSGKLVSSIGISKSNKGTEPGVPKGNRSLVDTRCKCSMETIRLFDEGQARCQGHKLVKSLISIQVTVAGR